MPRKRPGHSALPSTNIVLVRRCTVTLAGTQSSLASSLGCCSNSAAGEVYQDGFLKSTHTLRAQKFLPKRIISRNTAPPVPFLAPIRSATAGRALTRRPFVDRVGNRRVTDDFVSPATSPATLGSVSKVCPNALVGARGGAGGFSCPHTSAHDQGRHPPSAVCQSDV